MGRTRKQHTIVETIDEAYKLKLCDKYTHDYDILLVNAFGVQDLTGPVDQLANLLGVLHEYIKMLDDNDYLGDLEEENEHKCDA